MAEEYQNNDVVIERLNNVIAAIAKEEEKSLEWREMFCRKLDQIFKALDGLPCEGRIEQTKGIQKDIGWLQKITYTALCLIIPALVSLGIAWGSIHTTVSFHEQELSRIRKIRAQEQKGEI
jgi:hypothetical protein